MMPASHSANDAAAAHVFEHQALLGTVVEVRVGAPDALVAAAVDNLVTAEIVRLQAMFSAFDSNSELCRWRNGESASPSPEFSNLMGHVIDWHLRSAGRFNPLAGALSEIWRRAEETGTVPSPASLEAVADSIRAPRFEMVDGEPVLVGDCLEMNLNAIAKGFIVDRALDASQLLRASWVCVNAGGDLAHRGAGSVRVGIENPHRPYDNERPVAVLHVANAALATSGDSRRGFRVDGSWFGHVLDPRTGRPVDEIASISVVATNAMTADIVATVAGVMSPPDAVRYLEELDGVVGGLVIDRERRQWETKRWAELLVTES